ncbi:isoprenylcysteine carboxylmethyltransferase family protein [Hyphomicrobium sp. CS1GBMeth3]|uniref:methyltransferase family protein n=1 Tax=Hyphomicrobium sp. CS1GBMeth3 TaxID=1892845 RepID=UPI000AFFD747|nr:isoprenylcysteine carboxylmethyltransferase family protein [Hyphomicrobium sp. CS1GBMeth3]
MPETAAPPATVPWPPILVAGLVAAAVALSYAFPLAWPGESDLLGHIAGLGLGATGLALFVWAALTLHRHGTTILPDKAADALVTDGPFRFRRNPIYISHVFMLFGIAELTHNIWFVILAILYIPLVTWLAVLPEERHLEARFGDAYRDYASRTRRWI